MCTNQTSWFNTVFSHTTQCAGFYACYWGIALWLLQAVMTEKEKHPLVVFTSTPHPPTLQIPTSFSHRPFPSLRLSLGLTRSPVPYISFYMRSPSYMMLYQFPLISSHFLCLLPSSHSFPQPTFHPLLWGVFFLSDIDWIYSPAAAQLWKWVILCCMLSLHRQSYRDVCDTMGWCMCGAFPGPCGMKADHVDPECVCRVSVCMSM